MDIKRTVAPSYSARGLLSVGRRGAGFQWATGTPRAAASPSRLGPHGMAYESVVRRDVTAGLGWVQTRGRLKKSDPAMSCGFHREKHCMVQPNDRMSISRARSLNRQNVDMDGKVSETIRK